MHALFLAAVFGLTAPAPADDAPITLKFKPAKAGDKTKETVDERGLMSIVITAGGEEMTHKVETTEKFEFTEEVIDAPADPKDKKGYSKIKRAYTEAEIKGDELEGELGLAGNTVVITGKEGKYEYKLDDGGDVSEAAKKYFDEEFRDTGISDEDMLPDNPVKPGDTWTIDTNKVLSLLPDGMTGDAAGSSASGKLVKTYMKDGKTYGLIEVTMELVVTKFKQDDDEEAVALKGGSKLVIEMTIDGCVDGTTHEGTVKQTVKGELRPDVPEVELVIKIESTRTSTTTEVGK
jgi:hypothetical protein